MPFYFLIFAPFKVLYVKVGKDFFFERGKKVRPNKIDSLVSDVYQTFNLQWKKEPAFMLLTKKSPHLGILVDLFQIFSHIAPSVRETRIIVCN